jgi:hypothetical protein
MRNRASFLENGLSTISGVVAVALYSWSLSLPAFECWNNGRSATGIEVLLNGWTGLFVFEFRWLANMLFPVLVLLQFFLGRLFAGRGYWAALLPPLVASLFALASMLWPSPGCGMSAGTAVYSKAIGPGGKLWVAAMFLTSATYVIRVLVEACRERANKPLHPRAHDEAHH